jgi:hypothetical protein
MTYDTVPFSHQRRIPCDRERNAWESRRAFLDDRAIENMIGKRRVHFTYQGDIHIDR